MPHCAYLADVSSILHSQDQLRSIRRQQVPVLSLIPLLSVQNLEEKSNDICPQHSNVCLFVCFNQTFVYCYKLMYLTLLSSSLTCLTWAISLASPSYRLVVRTLFPSMRYLTWRQYVLFLIILEYSEIKSSLKNYIFFMVFIRHFSAISHVIQDIALSFTFMLHDLEGKY